MPISSPPMPTSQAEVVPPNTMAMPASERIEKKGSRSEAGRK